MAQRRKDGKFAKGNTAAQGKRAPRTDAGWVNWATGHGMMGRDKREGTFFESQYFAFDALAELWKGDDLAARAIETPVKEALRPGWDIIVSEADEDGDEAQGQDESERVNDVVDKLQKLGAKQILNTAWCYERGLGGGCVLLGANDGASDLTKPLDLDEVAARSKFLRGRKSTVAQSGFDWMTPLEPREIYPMYGYADPRQPKYGQPEIYRMTSRAVLPPFGGQYAETVFDVHESRLLVFPGIRVSRYQAQAPQGGWGDSILVRMWRVLRDFNLAWGSAGVLVSEFARGTYKWKDLVESITTEQGQAGAMARLQFMEWAASTINATVIDAEDDYKREAIPLTGLADLLNQFATRLAACADQPLTVLFGTSPAGLNATGESDIRLFYDRIDGLRHDKLLPQLERVIQLAFLTTGDGKIPDKWSVRFRPLWQQTAEERSQAMLTQAQADHIWWQDGVLSSEEIADSHWGAGEWNPEIKIDFEARKKQQLATHSVVTPEDLHALGKGNGPGPGGAPGMGKLPPTHPDHPLNKLPLSHPDNPNYVPPPPPGTGAKPGAQTANSTGGQNFPPPTKARAKGAKPDPNTRPQPNVQGDSADPVDELAARRRAKRDAEDAAYDDREPPRGNGEGVLAPEQPDPWGVRDDDDDDDDDGLTAVVAALHAHLQKKAAKKKGKYTPPPPQGSAEPSKPTTTPGPPAAPDPNAAPQPYVNQMDDDSKAGDVTGPAWPQHAAPAPAPQGPPAPPAAIDEPAAERADDFNPAEARDPNGRWTGGAAEALAERAKEQGGDTFDPRSGDHPAKGYAVSVYKGREQTIDGKDKIDGQHIRDFVEKNKDLLDDPATKSHVGSWYNPEDDKWYLDVSRVEPKLSDAAKLASDHQQLAIYDLKRGESINAQEYPDAIAGTGRFAGRTDAARPSARPGVLPGDGPRRDGQGDERAPQEGPRAAGPSARPAVRALAHLDVGPVTTPIPTPEELAERARAAEGPIPETDTPPSGTAEDPGAGPLAQSPRKKRKGVELPGRLTSDKKKDHE